MIFLVPVSVLAFALNGTLTRWVQIKFPARIGLLRVYQALFCLFAALAFTASHFISGKVLDFGIYELLYGAVFGVFFFLAVVGASVGYESGSMALTAMITNMSLIIPLVYSCVFAREKMTALQIIGIALIFLTMILAINREKGKSKGASPKWFLAVMLAFFSNGITAITQKHYILVHTDYSLMLFMGTAYLVAAVLFFANAAILQKSSKEKIFQNGKAVIPMAAASGIGSFGGNALLGILSTQIVGAVLYPCINGGLCVVSALISFALFKEKPSARKFAAIAIGVVAIVILNI